MKVAFISTAAIAQTTRSSISEIQSELAKAQHELATGQHQDAGLALGYKVGRTVSMRQEFDQLEVIGQTNGLLGERLTTTQDALGQLVAGAQSMMATLFASRNATDGPEVAALEARSALESMNELLNISFGGARIFGGINTDIAPIATYYASPTSLPKQAIDADFLAAFGVSQSSASVATIDGTSMQAFLDGAFATNFDSAPWAANWSAASDQIIESRISISMTVRTSVSANEEPFRKLAQALTMVADLGAENLNQSAFHAIADTSIGLLGETINGLTQLQSQMAVAQEGIRSANERMDLQKQVLIGGVQNLEGVDPFEASTRATSLLTQLETSFAVTARIQRLTLTNYL